MKNLILLASLFAALFCSCKSVEKQRRQAVEFYQAHPIEMAEICADRYPPKIEYKKGDSVLVKGDTVFVKGETLVCPDIPAIGKEPAKLGKVFTCPGSKVVTNTIRIVDTLPIENTARINVLLYNLQSVSEELNKTKTELSEANKKRRANLWTWIILVLIGAGLAFLNLKNKVAWKQ